MTFIGKGFFQNWAVFYHVHVETWVKKVWMQTVKLRIIFFHMVIWIQACWSYTQHKIKQKYTWNITVSWLFHYIIHATNTKRVKLEVL